MKDRTVINSKGYTLGASGGQSVYEVVEGPCSPGAVEDKSGPEFPNQKMDSQNVRVSIGPGFADFTRGQIRTIENIVGFGRVAVVHSSEKPRRVENPFAEALETSGPWAPEKIQGPFGRTLESIGD